MPVPHVAIENRQRVVRVQLRPLEEFLKNVEGEIGLGPECVAVRLIGDAEMARLNETYRKKKGPTDVLSFPAAADSAKAGTLRRQVRKGAADSWETSRFRRRWRGEMQNRWGGNFRRS